jgi:16S rRNA C967 or C1407 C5-methylase (RsmB/RsmF family)
VDFKKGEKCVRVNPFVEESDGFFVALFQRK